MMNSAMVLRSASAIGATGASGSPSLKRAMAWYMACAASMKSLGLSRTIVSPRPFLYFQRRYGMSG